MIIYKNHLRRKVEKVIDFNKVYEITEKYYSKNTGRPCCDPVIVVKILLIQHLYGIRSLRQTIEEIKVNMVYRWFLYYNIDTNIPHL